MPPEPPSRDAWVSRERVSPGPEEEFAPPTSRMALWQEMLRAVARARTAGRVPARTRPRLARSAGGCLLRVVVVVVLLLFALATAAFMFGQALLGF